MKETKENIMVILAIIGVIAPLAIIGVLIYKGAEPSALVSGFIGMIVGAYTTVFGYYFGSSSSSKSKSDQIESMISSKTV
jgi:membrane protein DedA with SNARE-associated domain